VTNGVTGLDKDSGGEQPLTDADKLCDVSTGMALTITCLLTVVVTMSPLMYLAYMYIKFAMKN